MSGNRVGKTFLLWVLPVAVMVLSCWGQTQCRVTLKEDVVLTGEELTLRDLLDPDTCLSLWPAGRIHLGKAPRAGSPRVLGAEETQSLLIKAGLDGRDRRLTLAEIPQRIVVRREGTNLSCSEIVATIPQESDKHESEPPSQCGAGDRISSAAMLVAAGKRWDQSLHSWQWVVHCVNPEDCVPFLVRAPDGGAPSSFASGKLVPSSPPAGNSQGVFLVRAGERAVLSWQSVGIGVVLSAVPLENGRLGDAVRVRLLSNNRILRAQVIGAGSLQVQP